MQHLNFKYQCYSRNWIRTNARLPDQRLRLCSSRTQQEAEALARNNILTTFSGALISENWIVHKCDPTIIWKYSYYTYHGNLSTNKRLHEIRNNRSITKPAITIDANQSTYSIMTWTFQLYVSVQPVGWTEMRHWSFSKWFHWIQWQKYMPLKGLEPATSCVRDQDATTVPARYMWGTVS